MGDHSLHSQVPPRLEKAHKSFGPRCKSLEVVISPALTPDPSHRCDRIDSRDLHRPCRLCPHVVVVGPSLLGPERFSQPDRLKVTDQTKLDTGFTPCAREGQVRFPYALLSLIRAPFLSAIPLGCVCAKNLYLMLYKKVFLFN